MPSLVIRMGPSPGATQTSAAAERAAATAAAYVAGPSIKASAAHVAATGASYASVGRVSVRPGVAAGTGLANNAASVQPPTFSNIVESNVTTTGVTIAWNVSPGSTGQIEYGTTTAMLLSSGLESSYLTFHQQDLSGLVPNTLYYYRIKGITAAGAVGYSAQDTFTTLTSTWIYPPDQVGLTFIAEPNPPQALPAYLVPIPDQMIAGRTNMRVTNVTNYHPRSTGVQMWNADGSALWLVQQSGTPGRFLHGTTYALINAAGNYGYWWDATDPDLMYFVSGDGGQLMRKHPISGAADTLLHNFISDGWTSAYIDTHSDISWSSRYFPMAGVQGGVKKVWVYDQVANTSTSSVVASAEKSNINISASGQFALVAFSFTPDQGKRQDMVAFYGPAHPLVLNSTVAAMTPMPYGGPSAFGQSSGRIALYGGHACMGQDTNGEDVYVSCTWDGGHIGPGGSTNGDNLNTVTMIRLRDNYMTHILPYAQNVGQQSAFAYGAHVACNAYDMPGAPGEANGAWAFLSEASYIPISGTMPGAGQIVAVKLKPATVDGGSNTSPICKVYGYEQIGSWNSGNDPVSNQYPYAAVSRDGTRVLAQSAWRITSADTSNYMYEYRAV